jgi:hypothetical protein
LHLHDRLLKGALVVLSDDNIGLSFCGRRDIGLKGLEGARLSAIRSASGFVIRADQQEAGEFAVKSLGAQRLAADDWFKS